MYQEQSYLLHYITCFLCSDGTVLACVSGRDIMIYETSSLWHHPGQARPFQTITHHESEDIVDLKFNPGNFCDASITW